MREHFNSLKVNVAKVFTCAVIVLGVHGVAGAVQVDLDTGETIDIDSGVVKVCQSEGMNLGACACVVSIMLEKEGAHSLSLAQMTRLADQYPNEYSQARSHCISVN